MTMVVDILTNITIVNNAYIKFAFKKQTKKQPVLDKTSKTNYLIFLKNIPFSQPNSSNPNRV